MFCPCGGSQRSTRIAKGMLFDAASGEPLPNPNDDRRERGGSGWDDTHSILLLAPLVPGYAPPLGLASSGDEFLIAVRQRGSQRPDRPAPNPLRLLRIDGEGRRRDEVGNLPLLDDGQTECSQPAIASVGDAGYLVAYRSGDEPGKVRIVCRTVGK